MSHELSFTPKVVQPCEESWAGMIGSARERHCAACDREVYNFAAMTAREIERVVRRTEGRLCARITQREDGSLVTLEGRTRISLAAQMVASASLAIGAAGALAQSSGEHSVAQADAPGAVRCEKAKKLIADAEAADRSEAARSTTVGEVVVVEGSSIEPVREPLTAKIAGEDFAAAGEAILTGTVLKPDASGPVSNARVILRQGDDVVATATADSAGMFRVAARPGIYNILIRQSVLFGTQVFAAKLHAGDQSLGQIKTHFYYVHDDGSPYEGGVTMGVLASIRTYSLASAIRHPWSYLKYLARKL